MATSVLLTVDTELTWRHYAAGLSWQDNFARSYEAAGVGIPYQLRMLAEHDLKACFFVDPMPALHYGLDPVRRMVDPILEAGQEVQLHLHPFWAGLGDENGEDPIFELTAFPLELQHDLIRDARDLLIEAGVPGPIAFRSGSYAANADTLGALARLGIRYDSSHNGSHHPWPSALPLDPAQIAPVRHRGVTIVPVTQARDRPGRLRHLQLCAVSAAEMRAALIHAAANHHPLVTIVSHSFELATRDGLRPNRTLCRRFEKLCRFLARRRDALPTAHFADLGAMPLEQEATPLPPDRLRTNLRVAEQIWAEARYERPASALTALSGTSATGLEILLSYAAR